MRAQRVWVHERDNVTASPAPLTPLMSARIQTRGPGGWQDFICPLGYKVLLGRGDGSPGNWSVLLPLCCPSESAVPVYTHMALRILDLRLLAILFLGSGLLATVLAFDNTRKDNVRTSLDAKGRS